MWNNMSACNGYTVLFMRMTVPASPTGWCWGGALPDAAGIQQKSRYSLQTSSGETASGTDVPRIRTEISDNCQVCKFRHLAKFLMRKFSVMMPVLLLFQCFLFNWFRQTALETEKERAKNIAALPPPPKDPVLDLQKPESKY